MKPNSNLKDDQAIEVLSSYLMGGKERIVFVINSKDEKNPVYWQG